MKETVTIEFTEEQSAIISPFLLAMSKGEATIAQVYIDGFRVKVSGEGRRYAFGDVISLGDEDEN